MIGGRQIDDRMIDAIKGRVDIVNVVSSRVRLERRGNKFFGLCPFHNEKTPSFCVRPGRGTFRCYGACGAHGDVIGFVMRAQGLSFPEAVHELLKRGGLEQDAKAIEESARRERKARLAREAEDRRRRAKEQESAARLWSMGVPAKGTLVEWYWITRGLMLDPPPTIRFIKALDYWVQVEAPHCEGVPPDRRPARPVSLGRFAAQVALIQGTDNKPCGAHVTWLKPDGSGKLDDLVHPDTGEVLPSRKIRGVSWGGAVRLTPAAEHMTFAEGIETAASIVQETRAHVWALLSIGNFAGRGLGKGKPHPTRPNAQLPSTVPDMNRPGFVLPAIVRRACWAADSDNADPASAECLVRCGLQRWRRAGVDTRIVRAADGHDFNSMLTRVA